MTDPKSLERLRSRQPVFGVVQTIPVPTITELALWSGYDFVILDCEHGVVDEPAQLACLQVISGSGASSIVRVRPGDLQAVGRYLDFGADGILMPDLRKADDASAFVAAATRAPQGTRGSTGSARASRYGLSTGENAAPLLLGLAESGEAAANINSIVAVPGLDGIVIGPSDLSDDLGCSGDYSLPVYCTAIETIERATSAARLLLGSRPHPGFDLSRLARAGHTLFIASSDIGVMRGGFGGDLKAARAALEPAQ